jgi:hypothetical protein
LLWLRLEPPILTLDFTTRPAFLVLFVMRMASLSVPLTTPTLR